MYYLQVSLKCVYIIFTYFGAKITISAVFSPLNVFFFRLVYFRQLFAAARSQGTDKVIALSLVAAILYKVG